jgi:hypothetical protein
MAIYNLVPGYTILRQGKIKHRVQRTAAPQSATISSASIHNRNRHSSPKAAAARAQTYHYQAALVITPASN